MSVGPHVPQFSGLWPQTGIYTISSPGSQAFRLRLNYTTSIPGSSACRWQIVVLLILHNHVWANFYNKAPLLYLYLYILLVMFLRRTLTQILVPGVGSTTWTPTHQGQPGYGHCGLCLSSSVEWSVCRLGGTFKALPHFKSPLLVTFCWTLQCPLHVYVVSQLARDVGKLI